MNLSDISEAINHLRKYNDIFSFKGDWSLFHAWITEGCDLKLDIMPVLKDMCSRNPRITSVAYFRPAIFRKRDNRLSEKKAITTVKLASDGKLDPYSKARMIAWKMRKAKGMYIPDSDIAYLNQFESQHGRIEV